MAFSSWLRSLKNRRVRQNPPASNPASRRSALRPRLEVLEDRTVLSATFSSVLGIGNDTANQIAWDNAVDSAGNTYLTGILKGAVDFDPAVVHLDNSDILTAHGFSDAFVAKYAPDNSLVWARRMGGEYGAPLNNTDGVDTAWNVAVDGAGNVYVTGDFTRQADFGPFTLTGAGSSDAFVTKLDSNGNFLWANRWGGASTMDSGKGIAVDAAGNVFSVGFTATIFSNGWIANGFEMHKYSPNGATVWAKRIDNSGGIADGVAADAAGNVYLSGSFSGTVNFNPDAGKKQTVTGAAVVTSGQGVNAFVLKLTAAGAFSWVTPFVALTKQSPNASVYVPDLAVDAAGNVAVGGSYTGQVDFNPSPSIDYRLPNISTSDGFVAKLTPAGAVAWATPLGGGGVSSVALDSSGAVYATGTFSQVFTPGFGIPAVTSNGQGDVFAAKLTSTGSVSWAVTFGGTGRDNGTGIAVDAAGNVYLCGFYSATVDFDPDPLNVYQLVNAASWDIFLLKLTQP